MPRPQHRIELSKLVDCDCDVLMRAVKTLGTVTCENKRVDRQTFEAVLHDVWMARNRRTRAQDLDEPF